MRLVVIGNDQTRLFQSEKSCNEVPTLVLLIRWKSARELTSFIQAF